MRIQAFLFCLRYFQFIFVSPLFLRFTGSQYGDCVCVCVCIIHCNMHQSFTETFSSVGLWREYIDEKKAGKIKRVDR